MKIIFAFLITISSSFAFSWEGREEWTSEITQELILNCESSESLCLNVCQDQYQCRMDAGFCRNCIGTNIFLSFFYQEVGRWFVNSGEKLPETYLEDYLKSKNFVLLTATGPYNIFSSVNDLRMESAFNSLCPNKMGSFPVVLGTQNRKKELTGVEAVICHGDQGAEIYRLNSKPNVDIQLQKLRYILTQR